jgi:DNA-binding LacI/PurR family transcriptional regulator
MKKSGLTPKIIGGPENHHIDMPERPRVIRQQLQNPDRPTAVLSNDSHVEMLIEALSLGISIPKDLHIAAFVGGNSGSLQSRITSLCEPNEIMGEKAVDMLIRKIEDRTRKLTPQILQIQMIKAMELNN